MPRHYSLYEAKAKLSALVREVREGGTVIITVHGQPAAELRPIAPPADRKQTNEERLAELEALGLITPSQCSPKEFAERLKHLKITPVPGALQRFLDDRE